MEQHIKILSVLFILFGIVGVVAAIGLFVFGTGAVMTMLADTGNTDVRVAAPWLAGCITVLAVLLGMLGLPSIIAGWGLSQHKSWARILTIVLAIFTLPHMPVGTALGLYALIVMFNDETKRLLVA